MLQIAIEHRFHAYELSIQFRGIRKQKIKSKLSVELIFSWGKTVVIRENRLLYLHSSISN